MKKNCKTFFILVGILLIIIVILLIINNSIYAKRKNIIEKFSAAFAAAGAEADQIDAASAAETERIRKEEEAEKARVAAETARIAAAKAKEEEDAKAKEEADAKAKARLAEEARLAEVATTATTTEATPVINYNTCDKTPWGGPVPDDIKNFCCNDKSFLNSITTHTKKNPPERSVKYSHAAALCDTTCSPVPPDKKILISCKYHKDYDQYLKKVAADKKAAEDKRIAEYEHNKNEAIRGTCKTFCDKYDSDINKCNTESKNDLKTIYDRRSINTMCTCSFEVGKGCTISNARSI